MGSPANHAMHETLEVAHGFTDWFDTGIYLFTTIEPHSGWHFVGSHLHPRLTVAESGRRPLGFSLGQEVGYQRRQFSENTGRTNYNLSSTRNGDACTWPSIPRSTEPCMVTTCISDGSSHPARKFPTTSPRKLPADSNITATWDPPQICTLSIANIINSFRRSISISPMWELILAVGWDPNHSSDHLIVKFIVGRRFNWGRRK